MNIYCHKYSFLLKLHVCNYKIDGTSGDPFDLSNVAENLPVSTGVVKKTPQSFLGENSALVNLDNLVSASTIKSVAPTSTGKILLINGILNYRERQVQYSECLQSAYTLMEYVRHFHIFIF